jgi:signal transduction histidine kinase
VRQLRWQLLVMPMLVLVVSVALELAMALHAVFGAVDAVPPGPPSALTARVDGILRSSLPAAFRQAALDRLARGEDATLLYVPTRQGTPVARAGGVAVPAGFSLPSAAWATVLTGGAWHGRLQGGRLIVTAMPAVWDAKVHGAVVWVTRSRATLLAAAVTRNVVLAGVVAFLLGVVLWGAQSRRLSRPLEELARIASRLGQGDLAARPKVTGPQEYQALAQALSGLAQSLESAELARREFLATVAHELRTPLTALSGFLRALGDGTVRPEEEDLYRDKCLDEVDRMSRLLDDLLDMAKAEAGRLELAIRPASLTDLVSRAVLLWEHAIRQKDLHMQARIPPGPLLAEIDPDRVVQIVSNLLSNAVRYTPAGGDVSVALEEAVDAQGRREAIITVSDTGPAIPEEILPRLWDRYVRWLPSGRSRGTGLGLAIVRTLAEAHGGSVQAFSQGGVNRFQVHLPLVSPLVREECASETGRAAPGGGGS